MKLVKSETGFLANKHKFQISLPDDSIDLVVITYRQENLATIYCGGKNLQFSLFNPAYGPDLQVISEHFLGADIFIKWQEMSDFKWHDFPSITLISVLTEVAISRTYREWGM